MKKFAVAAALLSAVVATPALAAEGGEAHVEVRGGYVTGSGLDDATIGFITTLDSNTADDTLLVTSGALSRLIGRPTTPIADAVRSWARTA